MPPCPKRRRIGQVSYYFHHGAWHVYYRQGGQPVRRRVGRDELAAARVAAELNLQLAAELPTLFSFTPLSVAELQQKFLDHHEYVVRSSLATTNRYRTATEHLVRDSQSAAKTALAHQIDADRFVRDLRELRVAPNGHLNATPRRLRDKGVQFVLQTCRSLYSYASKKRHLPPYMENPFSGLGGRRFRIDDAKPIFVFDQQAELEFFRQADDWSFPLHFLLAKTGLRPGEAVHLLIEDLDLDQGWLRVRNQPQLGWNIKTRRERSVPLVDELTMVLRRSIAGRRAGPVFLRQKVATSAAPLSGMDRRRLAAEAERRIVEAERQSSTPVSRSQAARIYQRMWHEAGAVRLDRVRLSFIRSARRAALGQATCPKSWRHTFATLLQEANIDLLVRQITLGHAPLGGAQGALGMTTVYTHTRPQTQRREIVRAMALWPQTIALARQWAQGAHMIDREHPLIPKNPHGRLQVLGLGRISKAKETEEQSKVTLESSEMAAKQYLSKHYDGEIEFLFLGEQISGMVVDRETMLEAYRLVETREWDLVLAEELRCVYRNPRHQLAFVQDMVDLEQRFISIVDCLDTADENWATNLAIATVRHGLTVDDASRRVRRTADKAFSGGGMVLKVGYGYRRLSREEAKSGQFGPVGLREVKIPEATPVWRDIRTMLIATRSPAYAIEWLKAQKIPTGPYVRDEEWRTANLKGAARNPKLYGTRVFRRTKCIRIYKTGKVRRQAQLRTRARICARTGAHDARGTGIHVGGRGLGN